MHWDWKCCEIALYRTTGGLQNDSVQSSVVAGPSFALVYIALFLCSCTQNTQFQITRAVEKINFLQLNAALYCPHNEMKLKQNSL